MTIKKMVKKDRDYVYFRGSRKAYERTIWTDGDKFFCKWYGSFIEVRHGRFGGYVTVEAY